MLNRGSVLAFTVTVFLATGGCDPSAVQETSPASGPASDQPRNLLLLTLDTTRPNSLGAYGQTQPVTPNLDRLAARGVRFDNAIAPMALTRPVHSTLFTGLLPHSHGVWSNGPYRLEPTWTTIAERFSQAGFETAGIVGSFVLSRSFGLDQGFDLFDDAMQELAGADPEKDASAVAEQAIKWLGKDMEPPFFLWLHLYDPHTPYSPPEPFLSRFPDNPYLSEVAFVDQAIGRVLSRLETLGWLDETLVVAVADHGEGLGEHLEDTHGYFLYDSTLKVPLIIAGPGAPAGDSISEQVTVADLAPTVLDAFGLESLPGRSDGQSFWREMQAGTVESRPALIEHRAIQHQYGWATLSGLRTEEWKWLWAPEPELYALVDDPNEERNVYDTHPDVARELEGTRRRLLPPEPETRAPSSLSPEAEAQLRSLGYLSAPSEAPPSHDGPDPKRVAAAISRIEELTTVRREQDPVAVARLTESVLAADPGNLFALRIKSELLVEQGRFAEAAEILVGIVEGHDTHPETLAYLAAAYEGLGRIDEAIAWLERATTPPWIFWPGLERMARLTTQHPEKLPKAATLEKLAVFQPESLRERMAVARAYSILGEAETAASWFERVLEVDPGSTEARVNLAQMQARMGLRDKALGTLSGVEPPTVESTFVTGSVLWLEGRKAEACASFRSAVTMDPRNANLLLALSRYLRQCGEPGLADVAIDTLLEHHPGHPQALAERRR